MYKVLSAIMMVAMLGAAGTSTSPHGRITGAQVMPGTGSVMNLTNVAVFQDWDPWGTTAITDILTAHSITFTIYGTADIGNVDLSNFDKVIFPSQQSFDFYLALSVNSPWLEAYIDNGGCVELHFATYDTYDPTGLVFGYGISVMHYPTVRPMTTWTGQFPAMRSSMCPIRSTMPNSTTGAIHLTDISRTTRQEPRFLL